MLTAIFINILYIYYICLHIHIDEKQNNFENPILQ